MGNTHLRVLSLSTQIMFTVLLSLCIGYAAGQTCQQAGSMCYRVTSSPVGLVGGSCCDSCRPYLPNGATAWTGTTDWYCMYTSGGTEGQSCSDYTGGCAAGLTAPTASAPAPPVQTAPPRPLRILTLLPQARPLLQPPQLQPQLPARPMAVTCVLTPTTGSPRPAALPTTASPSPPGRPSARRQSCRLARPATQMEFLWAPVHLV